MITATLAVTALLLPWVAGYLAIGIVAGPLLLRVVERAYGVRVDYLRDTPAAIIRWVGILAWMLKTESDRA